MNPNVESIKTSPPRSKNVYIVSNCAVLASSIIQTYLLRDFCALFSSEVMGPPIESLLVSVHEKKINLLQNDQVTTDATYCLRQW